MRYRKLDIDGDYVFGRGAGNFYVDEPLAVGQAIKTRLGLNLGEWFLNTSLGVPYDTQILGMGVLGRYDFAIQNVVNNTIGVKRIVSYNSSVNRVTRKARVNLTVDTIYGTKLTGVINLAGNMLDTNFILDESSLN